MRWLVGQSVLPSSRDTYNTGWRSWLSYTNELNVDPYLRRTPSDFSAASSHFGFPTTCLINFMFSRFQIQRLAASTILTYCAGILFFLKCANVDTSFFQSVATTMARSALSLLCRQRVAKREISKLPFTLDMILHFRHRSGLLTFRQRGIYVAMRLAFLLLLRVSEYTKTKADHYLRSDDVVFVTPSGYIYSHQLSVQTSAEVSGILITVRSAKNDPEKEGHRFFFQKVDPAEHDNCICTLLLTWAQEAQLRPGCQFFSYRDQWRLTAPEVSQTLQTVAIEFGLDPNRFTPHSLRYGGASALAAAKVPTYLIQQLGRWKSLAFLQYVKLSEQLLSMAQTHLANPRLFTAGAVIRAHAGAVLRHTEQER